MENKICLVAKTNLKKNANKMGLFYCVQEAPLAQEYAQETTSFCACAQKSKVSCCQRNNNHEFALLSTQPLEMDNKNNQPPVEGKEVTLEELLEEVAMLETASDKIEKVKTLWWLTEESLLGEVELDYSVDDNKLSTSKEKKELKEKNS